MKTITVTITVRGQSNDFPDPRLAFWEAFNRQFNRDSNQRESANQYEQRIRNLLPERLHRSSTSALLDRYDWHDRFDKLPVSSAKGARVRVAPGRLLVTVGEIRYGSMKIDLGIPDIDAFIELLGNNADAFEALFGAYLPPAIDNCLPGDTDSLDFQVAVPNDVREYINSSRGRKTSESDVTAKERGTALLVNLVQSPLILPILLICFLWYYARQDMVEERRINAGLIQTLVTEQTAVLSLLRDKQAESKKDASMTDHGSTTVATKPAPQASEK